MKTYVKHSETCEKIFYAYVEWVVDHPGFCANCGATGLNPECPDDPCSVCVEKGFCPMCGEEGLDEEGVACSLCGWKDGDPGAPYWDCACGDCTLEEVELSDDDRDVAMELEADLDAERDEDREADAFEAWVDANVFSSFQWMP